MGAGQPKPIKPSNEFLSAPTNINRPTGEINVKKEHNNYPAFISFNGDENYDEARFSIWTIVEAIGATLFLIYIIKRIRDCRRKSVAKKEEKAAKKEEIAKDAEKAGDSCLEALAMTPIKWNNDRFEEITEKIRIGANSNSLVRFIKNMINFLLSSFGVGDTLKVFWKKNNS